MNEERTPSRRPSPNLDGGDKTAGRLAGGRLRRRACRGGWSKGRAPRAVARSRHHNSAGHGRGTHGNRARGTIAANPGENGAERHSGAAGRWNVATGAGDRVCCRRNSDTSSAFENEGTHSSSLATTRRCAGPRRNASSSRRANSTAADSPCTWPPAIGTSISAHLRFGERSSSATPPCKWPMASAGAQVYERQAHRGRQPGHAGDHQSSHVRSASPR